MSNITKLNPWAFPHRVEDGCGGYEQFAGMTLRDYFAGQALAGELAYGVGGRSPKWVAGKSYAIADAMLAHRATNPLPETQTVSIEQNP